MDTPPSPQPVLVAYFSATGTTASVARALADATGGTLHEISPQTPYTHADLNWHDPHSRSSRDMHNPQSRPPILQKELNTGDYRVIFIGYPIWWDEAPREINTFLESYPLEGKKVIPFATSGGSSITHSIRQLERSYPSLNWGKGKLWHPGSTQAIRSWAEQELEN